MPCSASRGHRGGQVDARHDRIAWDAGPGRAATGGARTDGRLPPRRRPDSTGSAPAHRKGAPGDLRRRRGTRPVAPPRRAARVERLRPGLRAHSSSNPSPAAVVVPPRGPPRGHRRQLPAAARAALAGGRAAPTEVWHVTADDHTRQARLVDRHVPSARALRQRPAGCVRPTRPMRRSSRPPHIGRIASSSTRLTAGSPGKHEMAYAAARPAPKPLCDGHRSVRDDGRTW